MLRGKGRHLLLYVLISLITIWLLAACGGPEIVTVVVEADHEGGLIAEPNAATLPAQVEIGQNVADVSLNMMGGETVQIGDYAGDVVMLFFWSTDVHIRGGVQQTSIYGKRMADEGLAAFAVNSSNDSEAAISFYIKDFSSGLPVVIDADQSLMRLFGAGLQTTVWIGPDSEVRSIQRHFNFNDFREENLRYRVNAYLDDQSN